MSGRPLKIGLTGGIGSGKTTVAKLFEKLGVPVYYSDVETRRIINTNPQIKANIIKHFGEESYINGELNRKYIGGIVFLDSSKLQLLNDLTHPAVAEDVKNWFAKQTTPYAIEETAIIFETGIEKNFDYIIGVTAPEEIRIKRVMTRDNLSEAEVKHRINKQMSDSEKMKRCDFVILNDGTSSLESQVLEIELQI